MVLARGFECWSSSCRISCSKVSWTSLKKKIFFFEFFFLFCVVFVRAPEQPLVAVSEPPSASVATVLQFAPGSSSVPVSPAKVPAVTVVEASPVKPVSVAPTVEPSPVKTVPAVVEPSPHKSAPVAVVAASPARSASPARAASPAVGSASSSPARVASPAFGTPVRAADTRVTTPKTVVQTGEMFSPSFDDDDNDVSLAPDLLALSAQSTASSSSKIPDFVRPAVTVTNTVLPDSSWLTPPTAHKAISASPVVGSAISPKVLHMPSAEKARSPSQSPALFASSVAATPQQQPIAASESPLASVFNISGGNPAFTPLQPPSDQVASPLAQNTSVGSGILPVFTPAAAASGAATATLQPGPAFSPMQSAPVFSSPAASPSKSPVAFVAPVMENSASSMTIVATPTKEVTPTKLQQDWTAFADKLDVTSSPQASGQEDQQVAADVSFEEERAEEPATFGGYGLLSPIREETDEYALTSREHQITTTPARSMVSASPVQQQQQQQQQQSTVAPSTPVASIASPAHLNKASAPSSPAPAAAAAAAAPAPATVFSSSSPMKDAGMIFSPGAGVSAPTKSPSNGIFAQMTVSSSSDTFSFVTPSPLQDVHGETDFQSSVFVTPVKSPAARTASQNILTSASVSATPVAVALVSPLASPAMMQSVAEPSTAALVATPSAHNAVAAAAAAAALPVPAVSAEISELDRIKQKIRVWDVASPSKQQASVAAREKTPEKMAQRYTESDLAEARQRAEQAAVEANAKLRSEYLELQKKYEAEKAISQQMKEIVDEFEASIRILVDGHKAAMQNEKAAFVKLQSEHMRMLEIAEENQKKVEALNREKELASRELTNISAAVKAAEENVSKLTAQLDASTIKLRKKTKILCFLLTRIADINPSSNRLSRSSHWRMTEFNSSKQ